MGKNILKKVENFNSSKINNILNTITTLFVPFTNHFCYFVIAIKTHYYPCKLDIRLMFPYMILKLYLDSTF